MVEVDHGNGYKSVYGHMGKIYVNKGQEVTTDELLGEVGMTGHTTGPHTHLELAYNGQKIDPRPLLPELRNYPTADDFVVHESSAASTVSIPTNNTTTNTQPSSTYTPQPTPDPEDVKKAEEEKLTPEKISQDSLTTFLSQTKTENKTNLPINLTDSLPKTSANLIGYNQTDELSNILSKPVALKNTETKTKLEEFAQKNLTTLLAKSNPQPSSTPLPEGGRISLNIFGFLK
jgi:murein DD-endopeptidase MepM/ murein hydrolase activator NlpD